MPGPDQEAPHRGDWRLQLERDLGPRAPRGVEPLLPRDPPRRPRLESAYHTSRQEPHGREKEPTFYFYRRKSIPYHLDYCFIPRPWLPSVREVGVGEWKAWRKESDH